MGATSPRGGCQLNSIPPANMVGHCLEQIEKWTVFENSCYLTLQKITQSNLYSLSYPPGTFAKVIIFRGQPTWAPQKHIPFLSPRLKKLLKINLYIEVVHYRAVTTKVSLNSSFNLILQCCMEICFFKLNSMLSK